MIGRPPCLSVGGALDCRKIRVTWPVPGFRLFPVLDFTISDFQLQGGDLALCTLPDLRRAVAHPPSERCSNSRFRANHVWLNVLAHALRSQGTTLRLH